MTLSQAIQAKNTQMLLFQHLQKQFTKLYREGLMTSSELTKFLLGFLSDREKRMRGFAKMTAVQKWFDYLSEEKIYELLEEGFTVKELFKADALALEHMEGDK